MKERLQKVIARAGLASRRQAEELIVRGLVQVNGKTVTRLGHTVDPASDYVRVEGRVIRPEPLEYLLVNKPPGVLCAVSDESSRRLVVDLVKTRRRVYPAGRLDYHSEGLVVLTNDGDLAGRLTRAGAVEKRYRVKVRGCPEKDRIARLSRGLRIGGEKLAPCRIRLVKKSENCWFEVILRQGRNRQIRRMFEAIHHPVVKLRRIAIGPLQLSGLPAGGYRHLTDREVRELKQDLADRG